jgi:PKD domain/Kelch motif
MKSILKFAAFILLSGVLFHLSCKKEYSCENCKGNKPPIANAGLDHAITLPTDSVSLDGSLSSDPDGSISGYLWTKISGPASFTITNAPAAITVVKNLAAGSYQFELKVTDNDGLSAKDTMRVTVDSVITTNHPPIANAGADQIITLPVSTVNLDGFASSDPDNNITTYAWAKISGPSSFNIANANAAQTQVTNLVQGIYRFELKVTDASGLFSKDTVEITVVPQPPPPNCDIANRPIGDASLIPFIQLPEPRYGITIAAAGNKIFIAGGYTSYTTGGDPANYSNRVDIYDITTGQWTITQLSEPRAYDAVAVLGNKIFFAGGWNANGLRTTVDIYDVSSNIWSMTQLSQARRGIAGGTIDNKVFFAGGTIFIPIGGGYYTQQLLDRVDIYDASANSSSTASLSEGRYCINDLEKINVTVVGGKIFFSGGSCNTIQDCSSNRIDIYDAVTNTWSYENYMAQNGGSLFSGIAAGNKNYRVTGEYWAGGNIVEIRDEITHTTTYGCLSGTLYRPPVSNGNKLIFPVSTIPNYTLGRKLTHFDVYDLSTNTWSISKLPPPGVDPPLFISVNNEVYAIDGYSTGTGGGFLWDKINKLEF